MDGEGVDAAREFRRQRLMDEAMDGQATLSPKRLGYDIDPEMRFSAGASARMPGMQLGLVFHPQALRRESAGQSFCNDILYTHSVLKRERCILVNPLRRTTKKRRSLICQDLKVWALRSHNQPL